MAFIPDLYIIVATLAGITASILWSFFRVNHARRLVEFMQEVGNSLSLDETLSVVAGGLKRMCPYDCVAIYLRRDGKLIPQYVSGENFHLFSSLEIPLGEGLSGRVAETRKPIVNGDPSLEGAGKPSTMQSALAVPLEGSDGVVGVLTLYRARKDAFTGDHLRVLLSITTKAANSIENALRYRRAETCAITDTLTGLPNARSLFLHLDGELARCKRENRPLTLLVCDLNGFEKKLLRTVAQGLRENCREYDYVARMGGHELVVVLPGHPHGAVGAKIRNLSAVAAKAGSLAMSVGEAVYPGDGSDAEQLLAEANRRMFQAKRQLPATVVN